MTSEHELALAPEISPKSRTNNYHHFRARSSNFRQPVGERLDVVRVGAVRRSCSRGSSCPSGDRGTPCRHRADAATNRPGPPPDAQRARPHHRRFGRPPRPVVSRTFLYHNDQARSLIATAAGDRPAAGPDGKPDPAEAGWRQRALNAEHELKRALSEIATQRTRIGELLGRIRDLEHDLPPDGVQRVLAENHDLRARLRQAAQVHPSAEPPPTAALVNSPLATSTMCGRTPDPP